MFSINGESVQTLEILLLTTLISLVPSILVMTTSFARYLISFSFLRNAMGTQQTPPNLVLTGLALFLTLLTMNPAVEQIEQEAWIPYQAGEITGEEFVERAAVPIKEFMVRQTKVDTLKMFCDLADIPLPETISVQSTVNLPLRVLVPSFMTCELQRAFEIGFLLYIPFMLIDVVVSSTLMSMGMIMLPPSMISMPFKLLLFVLLDGWELLFSALIVGFK
ncbi:MAG: flagellar type III secretion system pore protein FliP [Clostridia bacterium]|nr:flagellar type III secretion system pore protein FliP [Clostridia bacterium]